MSKLKDINLSDLGIKSKITEFSDNFSNLSLNLGKKLNQNSYCEEKMFEKSGVSDKPYSLRRINNSLNMNNKFLKHVNIIENIKNKPGQYLDKRTEWEKELETEEFVSPSIPAEKNIPLTFRKFFYQTFPKNITDFALKNPEKLPGLVAEIKDNIQIDAQNWLDFVSDKQISALLCQIDNYSEKGKIYKKTDQFQNIVEVIQWIIDTNTKLLYESADWNKDGEKTFIREKEAILIIDTTLHKEIEIEGIKEQCRLNEKNPSTKFPLPLRKVWECFADVIIHPLKNNFQFIIVDKRALVGWKVFQNLEIKYDETNSTTYFCRKMEGGFKQLTYYNAVAFIHE